ncbi:unnamed protein product [Nippostrongylus brasiliensis]|uniref:AMP-binding_C domain-containing protein n=1 Tax=Nippostrongylus brasiliensis TaxID=27835 RepID=A0A0N4XZ29_NIPBR|nr:unnamed protein product [Nippostrongylus brasiliensis]
MVECALLNCPIIDNVCVYGCGLESNTVALVVPNPKHLEKIAKQVGEPSEDHHVMCRNEKVAAEFLRQLNEHAKKSECPPVRIDSILSVTIFILPGMKCHSFVDLVRIKYIQGRLLAKNAKKQTQASCVTK